MIGLKAGEEGEAGVMQAHRVLVEWLFPVGAILKVNIFCLLTSKLLNSEP